MLNFEEWPKLCGPTFELELGASEGHVAWGTRDA